MDKKDKVAHPTRMVRAVAQGFDNITLRQVGEEFLFSGAPGSWFVDVPAKVKKPDADDLA